VKALTPLAVAERDILALRTARENRPHSGDYMNASGPRPFSPPGPHRDRRRPHTSPASSLTHRVRSSLARLRRATEGATARANRTVTANRTATANRARIRHPHRSSGEGLRWS